MSLRQALSFEGKEQKAQAKKKVSMKGVGQQKTMSCQYVHARL